VELRERVLVFLRSRPLEWRPECSIFTDKPSQESGAMTVTCWVTHHLGWQETARLYASKSTFILTVLEICAAIGIDYVRPVQPLVFENTLRAAVAARTLPDALYLPPGMGSAAPGEGGGGGFPVDEPASSSGGGGGGDGAGGAGFSAAQHAWTGQGVGTSGVAGSPPGRPSVPIMSAEQAAAVSAAGGSGTASGAPGRGVGFANDHGHAGDRRGGVGPHAEGQARAAAAASAAAGQEQHRQEQQRHAAAVTRLVAAEEARQAELEAAALELGDVLDFYPIS
jgi:hypothetical protein